MNLKVMVTGGAGFIGSRLVKSLLLKNCEVHVLDVISLEKAKRLEDVKNNKNLFYKQGDLREKSTILNWYQKDASHLFHLASIVGVKNYMDDPLALIDIVVGGTRILLELASLNKTRVLFTSTSEVYGKNPLSPWSEDFDRVLGNTSIDRWSYSSSKAVCEHMLFALQRSADLKFSIVRFFNVYGPSQAPIFVVSKSIHQILNNKSPLLYDSGNQTRCFTFIDDAIEGVLRASQYESALGQIINIGSSNETTVNRLIEKIIKLSNKNIKPDNFITSSEYGSLYEDIPKRVPLVKKAKEILNWEAETSLDDGLIKSIEWAKKNTWWLHN